MGLKELRGGGGPKDPNKYWGRNPRKKCSCKHKMRGPNHDQGDAHSRSKGSGKRGKW